MSPQMWRGMRIAILLAVLVAAAIMGLTIVHEADNDLKRECTDGGGTIVAVHGYRTGWICERK